MVQLKRATFVKERVAHLLCFSAQKENADTMPRGFNVCPFFRLFLENAAEKVFSYWRRPGHIIMTLLPWNNARLLSLKKLTAHQMTTKIVWVFILLKTLNKDSSNVHTIQIQNQTHICMKSLWQFSSHLWNLFRIRPFPWNVIELPILKIWKYVKRWKLLRYQSCLFLLKTRVDFFGCAGKTLFLTEL